MDTPAHIDSNLRASLLSSAATLLKERAEHMARVREIDAQIGAIETLTGETLRVADASSATSSATPKEPETWLSFIISILSDVQGGKTGRQMVAAIKASPDFAVRFARSPNSYYNALQRLELQKRIVKVGKVTYLRETLEKIQAGVIEDQTITDAPGGMPAFITAVLGNSSHSMTAAEVLTELRQIPEAREKMEANKQIAYATLSRMVALELIKKDGDHYRVRDDQQPRPRAGLQLVRGDGKPM